MPTRSISAVGARSPPASADGRPPPSRSRDRLLPQSPSDRAGSGGVSAGTSLDNWNQGKVTYWCWGRGQRQSTSAQGRRRQFPPATRCCRETHVNVSSTDGRPACPPPALLHTFPLSARWPRRARLCRTPGAQGSDCRESSEAQTDAVELSLDASPTRRVHGRCGRLCALALSGVFCVEQPLFIM